MTELEEGNVDLLTYQQTIGGSIFKYDHATQDDVDFDEPLLECLRQKDDEEIIVLESWEIVAPLPVGEPPAPAVQCLPPSSQPAEPSVPEPAVPHTPAQAEYRQVNGRKRKSDVSHSVVGAGLRKRRRRCLNEPRPLSQLVSQSAVAQQFPGLGEIDKNIYRAFYGHPMFLTLEQGQFLLQRRLEELNFQLSENETPKDGSCLFHGLLDQMKSNTELQGEASSAQELRWKIVNYGYDFFLKTKKLTWVNTTETPEEENVRS